MTIDEEQKQQRKSNTLRFPLKNLCAPMSFDSGTGLANSLLIGRAEMEKHGKDRNCGAIARYLSREGRPRVDVWAPIDIKIEARRNSVRAIHRRHQVESRQAQIAELNRLTAMSANLFFLAGCCRGQMAKQGHAQGRNQINRKEISK